MVELLVFITATTIIAITLSKIRLAILVDQSSQGEDMISLFQAPRLVVKSRSVPPFPSRARLIFALLV